MYHHYLQRGHALTLLLNLSEQQQLFYLASMAVEIERNSSGGD